MRITRKPRRKTIRSVEEIPTRFASEDEEREWWATHDLSEELYDQLEATPSNAEDLLALGRIERLIQEVLGIIPSLTSGRGRFNSIPALGYQGRHPSDWQKDFLVLLDPGLLSDFSPDVDEIHPLILLVNEPRPVLPISEETLSTILGYVVFEMLVRRLTPALDEWGFLVQPVKGLKGDRPISGLSSVFKAFEASTQLTELRDDLRRLNACMKSGEPGRNGQTEEVDLYRRLERGRNFMLHGNLTRSSEGNLLILLIDLVVLHVMRQHLIPAEAA